MAANTIPSLEDAIAVGSFMLHGDKMKFAAGGTCVVAFVLLVFILVLWNRTSRMYRLAAQMSGALQGLQHTVGGLDLNIQALQNHVGQWQTLSTSGAPEPPNAEVANTMLCLDAKILDLNQETNKLRMAIQDINHQVAMCQPGLTEESLLPLKELLISMTEKHKKIADALPIIHTLPALTKTCQSMGLETQSQFKMQETMSDGLLRQGRESLQVISGDNKSTHERLAKLDDKLGKLDALADELKGMLKQLSIDVHVTRTEMKTKLDSAHTDLKRFYGELNSGIRGLNVLVPNHKTLLDTHKDSLDYLVRANQAETERMQAVQTTLETTTNVEDRLVRVETLCAGNAESLNDASDQLQQLRELLNLMMENVSTIMERTPKLPKRNPPAADAPQPQTSTTPPPAQPAPTPGTTTTTTTLPTVLDPQPLRLSDHLQPIVRDTPGQIYMVGSPTPLRNVSTQELLQALLSRGGHF